MLKKILMMYLLMFVFLVSGCSDKNMDSTEIKKNDVVTSEDVILNQDDAKQDDKEEVNNIEKVNLPSKIDLDVINDENKVYLNIEKAPLIDDVFSEGKKIDFPENGEMTPLLLKDGIIYGTLSGSLNETGILGIAKINVSDNSYERIFSEDNTQGYRVIGIRYIDEEKIIYEIYDYSNGELCYYNLYKDGDIKELAKINNVMAVHYTNITSWEDRIYVQIFNSEKMIYQIVEICESELKVIEENHSAYPIAYKDYLYYERINNDENITELVRYDIKNNQKEIIYSTDTIDYYIKGLYGNKEGDLILSLYNKNEYDVYHIDLDDYKNQYLFSMPWFEGAMVNNQYLTWLGDNLLADRRRPQYHLYDFKNKQFINNPNNMIILDEEAIVYVKYLKKDEEIQKGMIFNNENACIIYDSTSKAP